MELDPTLRVVLWSAPRSLSSVFERSVRELKEVKAIYEPHLQAYYYGPDRKESLTPFDPSATFEAADEDLLRVYSGYHSVFIKNHAYYVEGNYDHYIKGRFSNFKHTFLIRNPYKTITSLCKASRKCDFPYSPMKDSGMKQLYDLYMTVCENAAATNPVIIDADDLLNNPKKIMEQYCVDTGLPFREGMLTWKPGIVSDWKILPSFRVWHETAMMSSGFLKPSTETAAHKINKETTTCHEECDAAVKYSLPFYKAMYDARMQI